MSIPTHTPFPPSWYGAKPLTGLHNEDHRFPFAALAAEMNEADRDHYAEKLRPKPVWSDGGRELARRIAGGTGRRKVVGNTLSTSPAKGK